MTGTKKEFVKKVVKSADFWVRVDAIGTGVAVGTESVLLGIGACLPAVPFLLTGLGLVAAVGLGACALYSLFIGTTGTWAFLKDAHHDVFHSDKPRPARPEKQQSTFIDRLAHHPRIYPFAKKLAETKPGAKLVNSGLGKKLRYGLTQAQRDIFMVSLNTKGSLFVGGTAATYMVMHVLALPALTLHGIITAPMAIAALYASKSTFDITCSMKVLFRHIRKKIAEKKAKCAAAKTSAPVPVPVPVPVPAPAGPAPTVTPAFDKAANDSAPPAPLPAVIKPVTPPPAP